MSSHSPDPRFTSPIIIIIVSETSPEKVSRMQSSMFFPSSSVIMDGNPLSLSLSIHSPAWEPYSRVTMFIQLARAYTTYSIIYTKPNRVLLAVGKFHSQNCHSVSCARNESFIGSALPLLQITAEPTAEEDTRSVPTTDKVVKSR